MTPRLAGESDAEYIARVDADLAAVPLTEVERNRLAALLRPAAPRATARSRRASRARAAATHTAEVHA